LIKVDYSPAGNALAKPLPARHPDCPMRPPKFPHID
jgi:hypothetical protein